MIKSSTRRKPRHAARTAFKNEIRDLIRGASSGFLFGIPGSSLPGMLTSDCNAQTLAIKPKMTKKSNDNRF